VPDDNALRLREKIGFKRSAVAVARKLAVIVQAMLRSGQLFDRTGGVAASILPYRQAFALER
jgi:hypothetical protein